MLLLDSAIALVAASLSQKEIDGDGLTDDMLDIINGKVIPVLNLDKMTKDELNDYAVSIGLTDDVSMNMTKKEMIDTIKIKQGD